ncbi:TRAP transporter small permease [Marispirochaeta aestuarii]|uniref:TRAP transporter small permease n=1 Tax=Marispirochaeta aestuarii TaxID=1963862 RepID=UPI0029C68B63|nr:TRAP transporter small permease [Marispirochaeta aestuarii]
MSSGDNGPVLRIMGRVNHIILLIEKTSLIILMVGMLIFGFLQVFSRFILKAPIGWSEELLTYSFTWASFMGASMAIYTNSHFSVDLVTKHFSQKLLKTVRLVIWILICLFAVFLLYMGTRLAIANHIQRMNILPISMFWAYLSMPISGAFILIHGVEKTTEVYLNIESEALEDLE